MKIHLIGVGKMGLPVGVHLARGGHHVTVADMSPERLSLARAAGLAIGEEAGATGISNADVTFSSLPHDDALLAVGRNVAGKARAGSIYVDTSTVSPAASAQVAACLADARIAYVRVALSGNNQMAEAAQLTLLASGDRAAYERVSPLLDLLGPTKFWLGEAEQARSMKLVVNLMIAQTSAMLAEALTLGTKGGLGWKDMWDVIANSAVASPIVKAKSAQLAARDFQPTFTVVQMAKDLGLILSEAAARHVALPQAALTMQAMHTAMAQGEGGLDYAAIIRGVERSSGLDPDRVAA
jgi:3-hydroxyisobutyrate dehydrogenase-like beta-hydroxyacid dehydrogenase